jgi:uncharacterized protein
MSIDVHCHHFVMAESNGGFCHPKFASGLRVRWYLNQTGILNWQDAFLRRPPSREKIDELYAQKLIEQARGSTLEHIVLLAFDAVYDERGYRDLNKTRMYTPNIAIMKLRERAIASGCSKFLFGASVNPLRRDWEDELDEALESGAVLLKWLPNVMGFDPNARTQTMGRFYEKLRESGTPILMHVGFEYAVPNQNIAYSNLDRLEGPLRAGVTVIAAHCCGGRPVIDSKKMFDETKLMLVNYPNLYIDVSAMASFHRKSRFLAALADPLFSERMVFGTDYPIPVHKLAFPRAWGRDRPRNYFDQDQFIKRMYGLSASALWRGYLPLTRRLPAPVIDRAQSYI